MQGVRNDIDVEMRAMKYDRYKCKYTAPYPGKNDLLLVSFETF